jgi:hypothetical protein
MKNHFLRRYFIKNSALVAMVAFSLSLLSSRAAVMATGLQCEYLTDPLGIDVQTPRFTWQLSDADHSRGQKQTGYQVLVARSPALLAEGRADIWDSGKVVSAQSALVPFAGKKLASGENCFWKVRVWDKDKKPSAWSSPAHFSMGLLEPGDWTGPWIKHPTAPVVDHIWFRKTFTLRKKAASAFIYVASVGYHELYINSQKVDARVLAPSLTRLDKRVLYVSRGETAWPEYWDDTKPSRIHTCYTGIAAWFIKGLGGIREDPNQYGYQSFIIKPALVGNLTFAGAKTESLYGTILSCWEKKGDLIQMNVAIPVNSTATVYVPATDVRNVTEGGLAIPRAKSVKFLKMEGPNAVIQVQSGVYQLL